jgi:hypothetical protein
MRGLLKAFLLAPAVVSAFVLPPDQVADTNAELEQIDADPSGKRKGYSVCLSDI